MIYPCLTCEVAMDADLDTLLIALYVELTDRIIPSLGFARPPVGGVPEVTDAELVCLAVAQAHLGYVKERRWLRAAPARVGHLFPRIPSQPRYNTRLCALSPLMLQAMRYLAEHINASADIVRPAAAPSQCTDFGRTKPGALSAHPIFAIR